MVRERKVMRRWRRTAIALMVSTAVLMALLVSAVVCGIMRVKKDDRGLARVDITLSEVTLEDINSGYKSTKYPGNLLQLTTDGSVQTFENVEIRGRGNSTWVQTKKPYRIKFVDKTDLLGLGLAKKWALLSNPIDQSNLRIDTAFYLEQMLGEQYARVGDFVELYVDGNYYGLYYLTRTVDVSKRDIALNDPMGVLMELDNAYCEDAEYYYKLKSGDCLTLKEAVVSDNAAEAVKAFAQDFERLQTAAEKGDYEMVKSLADVESLAQYYLLSEFTYDLDAYVSSYFWYRDGADDKIHAGPGWDFDAAFGNLNWGDNSAESWRKTPDWVGGRKIEAFGGEIYDAEVGKTVQLKANTGLSRTLFYLTDVPEFGELVEKIYREKLAGRSEEVVGRLRERAKEIRAAGIANAKRWKYNDFDDEVDYLVDWLARRFEVFDRECGAAEE